MLRRWPPLRRVLFRNTRRGRPMWRPAVGCGDPACRLKFAFCPSSGPDFRRKPGDISPPGEVLSRDGKYPKIPGPSSSQSTLHSERPGVGIPRTLPCSSSPNHDFGSWLGSRGLRPYDFRTQGARLENVLNMFGAGMNLGPLRLPPAAARICQIHPSHLPPCASRMPCLSGSIW